VALITGNVGRVYGEMNHWQRPRSRAAMVAWWVRLNDVVSELFCSVDVYDEIITDVCCCRCLSWADLGIGVILGHKLGNNIFSPFPFPSSHYGRPPNPDMVYRERCQLFSWGLATELQPELNLVQYLAMALSGKRFSYIK